MKKSLVVLFCLLFVVWIKPDAQVGKLKKGFIKCESILHGIPSYSSKRWVTCKDASDGKTLRISNESIVYIKEK